MNLHRTANKFNLTEVEDAYNAATKLKLQLAPLEMYRIEGTSVKKREVSLAPDATIPARRCIRLDGEAYLVGDGTPDYWNGTPIRRNYVMQGADNLANLTTVANALANVAPSTAYAALAFNKNMTDDRDSSAYHTQYNLFFAPGEPVAEGGLVNIGSAWYLIRQAYLSSSGLLIALANEIEGTVFETITFGAKTYDPVTDTYSGATTSVKVLRIRWTDDFTYLSMGSAKFERGDMKVLMLKSAGTPKPSDTLTLSDGAWKVLSAQSEGTTWGLHVRRT